MVKNTSFGIKQGSIQILFLSFIVRYGEMISFSILSFCKCKMILTQHTSLGYCRINKIMYTKCSTELSTWLRAMLQEVIPNIIDWYKHLPSPLKFYRHKGQYIMFSEMKFSLPYTYIPIKPHFDIMIILICL